MDTKVNSQMNAVFAGFSCTGKQEKSKYTNSEPH